VRTAHAAPKAGVGLLKTAWQRLIAMPVQGDGTASLIEYPSQFPIKVMGNRVDGFVEAVVEVAKRFDPALDESKLELRPSREGNYLGITLTVTASSREQLDALYSALTSHPMIKVVL
jgi:putative lipoic acid-binding regulatory protein